MLIYKPSILYYILYTFFWSTLYGEDILRHGHKRQVRIQKSFHIYCNSKSTLSRDLTLSFYGNVYHLKYSECLRFYYIKNSVALVRERTIKTASVV